jgi:hypothetical protein
MSKQQNLVTIFDNLDPQIYLVMQLSQKQFGALDQGYI